MTRLTFPNTANLNYTSGIFYLQAVSQVPLQTDLINQDLVKVGPPKILTGRSYDLTRLLSFDTSYITVDQQLPGIIGYVLLKQIGSVFSELDNLICYSSSPELMTSPFNANIFFPSGAITIIIPVVFTKITKIIELTNRVIGANYISFQKGEGAPYPKVYQKVKSAPSGISSIILGTLTPN